MKKWFLIACVLSFSSIRIPAAEAINLRTDNRINPLGIDRLPAMLSWSMDADGRRGAAQSAYRIVAAASQSDLLAGKSVWDTGRVAASRSHQVAYDGPALKAGERVWWRVMIWDQDGKAGQWSEPAWFEAGLLNDKNWGDAEWIGDARDYKEPERAPAELMGPWMGPSDGSMASSYELQFDLPDVAVVSAAIYCYAKGGRRTVEINYGDLSRYALGQQARSGRREGGFADYADYLKPGGKNTIVIRITRPAEAVTFGMRIVFADGTEQVIQSGTDWKVVSDEQGPAQSAKVLEPYGGIRIGTADQYAQSSHGPAWFHKRVHVNRDLAKARLYVCALGEGLSYINGEVVDAVFFSSPQSDYEEFAYYTPHDVTEMLNEGDNALAILLNSSWYHQVGGFSQIFSYGHPGLKAKLVLQYKDGTAETVHSGNDWLWRPSAITLSNIYRGENIDYRLASADWKLPDIGSGWQPVQVLEPLTPKTVAIDVTPVRRDGALKPVRSWKVGAKSWLYDMGEMTHGIMRLKFNEPVGTVIRVRYSEYAENGQIVNAPLSHWSCHGVMQQNTIIADGKDRVFEPAFNPLSFRFVEVSGLSKEPSEGDVIGIPVHTEAEILSTFESSDPMLNRLYENGIRTFQNYINHLSGDIPRERCLWGMESVYSFATASYCFDWKNNHRLMNTLWWTGQKTKEGIPGHIGVGLRLSTNSRSFNWSSTPLYLDSFLLEFFEDPEPARRFYAKAKHFVDYFERTADSNCIPILNQLADHAAPTGVRRTPRDAKVITLLTFYDVQQRFARIADALGNEEDAAHARTYAAKIREAALKNFYDAEKHTFGNGTYDSLALSYGILEDDQEEIRMAETMVGYYRANGHQFDGGFMTHELYPQLSRFGYVEDAYKMLVNTDYPGPAWSVKTHDATSFYELYSINKEEQTKVGMNFWAFGHPTGWMITDLAGIRYAAPHGREMKLAPKVPRSGKLSHVTSSLKTPTGVVKSSWTFKEGLLSWSFTVPANASAEVHIPTDDSASIKGIESMKKIQSEEGVEVYQAVAGTYTVQSPLKIDQPSKPAAPAQTPVPAPVSAPVHSGGAAEWNVVKGCEKSVADGVLTITHGPLPTQMLTTRLPAFSGGNATVSFRMKTPATGKAMVRIVSVNANQKRVQIVEFNLGAQGVWNHYTIDLPAFEGSPFSLWIGLVHAAENLEFSEIRLISGTPLKTWKF